MVGRVSSSPLPTSANDIRITGSLAPFTAQKPLVSNQQQMMMNVDGESNYHHQEMDDGRREDGDVGLVVDRGTLVRSRNNNTTIASTMLIRNHNNHTDGTADHHTPNFPLLGTNPDHISTTGTTTATNSTVTTIASPLAANRSRSMASHAFQFGKKKKQTVAGSSNQTPPQHTIVTPNQPQLTHKNTHHHKLLLRG